MKKYIFKLLLLLYKVIHLLIKIVIIIIFLITLFISIYALYDSYQIHDSVKLDDTLKEIVKEESYDKMDKINKNIVGWIKIDKTNINYPILKGKDNVEYLNKNYKGEYSFSGSIFLDYRNNNFEDNYSIIYGHNLYNGGMFSDLKKYKNSNFFNTHLNGKLITKNETYSIKVLSYGVFKYNNENIYNLKKYNIDYILKKSNIKKTNNATKYIVLSTCKSASSPDRIILLCELKKSF